jgi:hypothetical protein
MTGKVWTVQEEAELKELIGAKCDVDVVAAKLCKSPKAVITKCHRLGLQLESEGYVNTSVPLPKELPSVEEAAKILAGALKASVKPGLSKVEVQRLQTVANIAKTYKELIVDYINYREVENKLNEVVDQNAKLQQALEKIQPKSSSSASLSVS